MLKEMTQEELMIVDGGWKDAIFERVTGVTTDEAKRVVVDTVIENLKNPNAVKPVRSEHNFRYGGW
ncbi:hypothetical protein Amet_1041 [Alkaliphilus metalliredigens QYMF]|uniref:Uncharacterized protein n=1 Tax=Alkaliphilus metalliredigens (strain QYMF) TaxID=293826 RepID=A6TM39_ALKMQ|nr:hypothetical protein [Alkaliphilus metalliredigens]ABR47257.1 hypothetical protein Amet_1041 [Alkaliphilus metalliredigens QYMF]